MSNINKILAQAAINHEISTDNLEATVATIQNVEIISFSSDSALLFVDFSEKSSLSSSIMRTHTAVFKTIDGGENWRQTLEANGGSFIKDEIFFFDEKKGWFLTQWQVAGTFPTLYWTTDFGETWQESLAIHELITGQGGSASFTQAQGLRFKSDQEGIAVGHNFGTDGENLVYFLATSDAGKTWVKIENLPKDYFLWKSVHLNQFEFSNPFWKITNTPSGFSIDKSIDVFSSIFPAAQL